MKLLKTSTLFLCMIASGCSYFQSQDATSESTRTETQVGHVGSSGRAFGATSTDKGASKSVLIEREVAKEWLDAHEKALREAIAGSEFTLERRDNALIVIAPVDYSFNPKRHAMLMPVTLNPLGKVAKLAQADPQSGILVLGHTDSTGSKEVNNKLSFERAQSVAAVFRLSGLKGDRLCLKGVGSGMPRADNNSAAGRAMNRRVEVLYTQRSTLLSLAQGY